MARATWFCVDIEASGPVPHLYDMISLGAVRVGADLTIGETFYVEIVPTAPRWQERTVPIHGLTRAHLLANGQPLSEALASLSAWVAAQTAEGSEPVFVGHNAPFDWSFVSYAYHAAGLHNPFGYKALDTKALASGVLGVHWLDSNKELLAEELELPAVETAKVHRADYDAWYQAHILVQLLKRGGICADS